MTQKEKVKEIENLRNEVDSIDRKITDLLNQRMQNSLLIGALKKQLGMELYSPEREKLIFINIFTEEKQYIPVESLRKIFQVIIDESLALQKKEIT